MPVRHCLAFALLAIAGSPFILGNPVIAATPAARSYDHLSVEVVGKGPDVILIPGLSTPRAVWRPLAQALAATHRVHLIQVRGFGEPAGANATGPVLAPLVEDIARYIAQAGLKAPAVIGHSMGGLAALMLETRHPGTAGRLMIVDALPWFGVLAAPSGMEVTVAMVEPRAKMIRDQLLATYGKPVDPQIVEANIGGQALDPANLPKLREWAGAADARVTAQLLYDDLTTDMRSDIAAIKVPVTVLYPTNEASQRKEMADPYYRLQYRALPGVRFVGIAGAAHFVMLDKPREFESAVRAFLSPAG